MSFSYIYLTRRVIFQNYRDYTAMGLIGIYGLTKFLQKCNKEQDKVILSRVYTEDESDMRFKETNNKTDGAVKRVKAM